MPLFILSLVNRALIACSDVDPAVWKALREMSEQFKAAVSNELMRQIYSEQMKQKRSEMLGVQEDEEVSQSEGLKCLRPNRLSLTHCIVT